MSGPDLCPKCKGLHYKNAPCIVRKPKVVGVDFGRDETVSTVVSEVNDDGELKFISITHEKPKRRVGRPKSITDMRAYKAEKQRKYRAKIKAQKEMGKLQRETIFSLTNKDTEE